MSQREGRKKERRQLNGLRWIGLDGMGSTGIDSPLATLAASVSQVLATWLCVYVSLVTDCR